MKNSFAALLLVLLAFSKLAWGTPVSVVAGKPNFAISDVSGHPAFTVAEQTMLLAAYGGSAIPYTPQAFEVNLSTCLYYVGADGEILISFQNNDEWLSCQTKVGLKRFIRKVRILIDSMSDLPAADRVEINQRAGWVRAYFQTLP